MIYRLCRYLIFNLSKTKWPEGSMTRYTLVHFLCNCKNFKIKVTGLFWLFCNFLKNDSIDPSGHFVYYDIFCTADFIKKVLLVYTHSMTSIYQSLSSKVSISTFFMKSPVAQTSITLFFLLLLERFKSWISPSFMNIIITFSVNLPLVFIYNLFKFNSNHQENVFFLVERHINYILEVLLVVG